MTNRSTNSTFSIRSKAKGISPILAILTSILVVVSMSAVASPASAATKAGAKCAKQGLTSKSGTSSFKCSKVTGKLIWVLAKPKAAPVVPIKTIAFVGALTPNVYYDNVLCGIKGAAASAKISIIDGTPSTFSATAQVSALQAIIARKPSAIIVGPAVATAVTFVLNDAISHGIRVAVVANPVFPVNAVTFINADISAATKLGVDEMARLLPNGGDVAIVALQPNSEIDSKRVAGYVAALVNYPSLKLVQTQYSGVNTANASQIVAGMLAADPGLAGILVTSGTPTVGVATQVKAAGKAGKVQVIGYDASPNSVEQLRAGTIQAIVSQLPRHAGQLAVKSLIDSNAGKKLSKEQNYAPFLITPANIDTAAGTAAIYSPCS